MVTVSLPTGRQIRDTQARSHGRSGDTGDNSTAFDAEPKVPTQVLYRLGSARTDFSMSVAERQANRIVTRRVDEHFRDSQLRKRDIDPDERVYVNTAPTVELL